MSLFERGEYLGRLERTKRKMAQAGLDALFVTSPENIYYLSGYAGWSFYVPQLLVVLPDQDEPVFFTRMMDVTCAQQSCFTSPENQIGYPEHYVGTPDRHPMEWIADYIAASGWAMGRVGVELNAHFFSVQSYRILEAKLGNTELVAADRLVDWVRTVKTEAEMALMRQAGQLADQAVMAAIESINSGVRECDAVAELYRAQIRGTTEFGGNVPNSVIVVAGERVATPHLRWTDAPYQRGDSVTMELSGSRHQYHAAIVRTVTLGPPAPELQLLADIIVEATSATIEVIKPGMTCEEVWATYRKATLKHGIEKEARCGYAEGICFQPTWIEPTMSFQKGDRTVLEPRMTFHFHGGMWVGRHSVSITESLAITETGCELLTRTPRRLYIKD